MVPKFAMYDGSIDPFGYLMHCHQVMTLDVGDDAFLCKSVPISLHELALAWFHCLFTNSINNFRELSEIFIVHYYA